MLDTIPRYLFNAKEKDEESGMYYYEARYYNPPTFISRDPAFEELYWISSYAYCLNNPVKLVDEDGEFPGLSNIVGAVVGAAVEYGSQVAANVIKDGFSTEAFTKNIDLVDIGVAAVEGAITSGGSVVKRAVTKAAVTVAAEVVKNTVDVKTTGEGGVDAKVNDASTIAKKTAVGVATSAVAKSLPIPKVNVKNTATPKEAVKQARTVAPVNRQQRIEIENKAVQNQQTVKEINATISKTPANVAGSTTSTVAKKQVEE
jgi:RHS repeat-associated protein